MWLFGALIFGVAMLFGDVEIGGKVHKCSCCCCSDDLYDIVHTGKAEYLYAGVMGNSREKSKVLCKNCLQEIKGIGGTIDILKYDIRKLS